MRWLKRLTEQQPLTYAFIPLLSVACLLPAYWLGSKTFFLTSFDLFNSWSEPSLWGWLSNLIGVIIISFIINWLVNSYNIFARPSLAAGILAIPILSIFFGSSVFQPALWALLFVLMSWKVWLDIYKQTRVLKSCFEAGLLLGLAIILLPEVSFLLPAYLIGIVRVRSLLWREWIWLIIGSALPVIYTMTLTFLIDDRLVFFLFETSRDRSFQPDWEMVVIATLVLLCFITIPPLSKTMVSGGRRVASLLSNLIMAQIFIAAIGVYGSVFGTYSNWGLLAPWIGISMALWIHQTKRGFFSNLLFFGFGAFCVISLMLRYGFLSL